MTKEEKDLLLNDLCARSPYGVKCKSKYFTSDTLSGIIIDGEETVFNFSVNNEGYIIQLYISGIKPYLFPLSSMTEEQKEELFKLCEFCIQEDWEGKKSEVYAIEIVSRLDPAYCYDHNFNLWNIDMRAINWLLKNHFDICGLIPKGLAIDATGKNIY